MKISFIVPEIVRSGGMRVIFEYANRLIIKGHDVTLYTPVMPFNAYEGQSNFEFQKYRIKSALKYYMNKSIIPENIFPYSFEIKYVSSVNNFFIPDGDAVIATSWTSSYSVNRLKASKGKKSYLVQDYEVWNCNEELAKGSYKLDLRKIVVSLYLKSLLSGIYCEESVEIMPGIKYDVFYNDNKIFNEPPVISFADHQLDNKNIKGAIDTAIKLKNKYPDLKVKAFGSSRFHEFPEFVEFIVCKVDDDVRKMYCSSDIFLFPSRYEGFGLPPAEAMACSCAVVGNAVAAFPEFSVHYKNAVHCDPDNSDGLYDGVCSLLDDRDGLKRISLAASEDIKKILNWDNSVNKFEEEIFN